MFDLTHSFRRFGVSWNKSGCIILKWFECRKSDVKLDKPWNVPRNKFSIPFAYNTNLSKLADIENSPGVKFLKRLCPSWSSFNATKPWNAVGLIYDVMRYVCINERKEKSEEINERYTYIHMYVRIGDVDGKLYRMFFDIGNIVAIFTGPCK